MKQGRRLTRSEKELLQKQHINPEDFCYLGECIGIDNRPSAYFKIQNKKTGSIKVICRFNGRGRT